jgi:tetratricopeptide (TPR) repeat protein
MKSGIFPAALCAVTLLAAGVARAQDRFQQPATLIYDAERYDDVWVGDANETTVLYFEREQAVNPERVERSKLQSVWLTEPRAYTEAIDLYQGRNYEEAREKFAEIRETYRKLIALPDNHSSLAAFYEMECLRKLERLEDLNEAQDRFLPADRESLTRPHQLRQLELYSMWDAVRTADWGRLELICRERLEQKMPGYQRAQVGYCMGLALEGQQRPIEAINAYNIAMTADTGASEVITANAALNALRLYSEDELVQQAVRFKGTPDEDPNSAATARIQEAAALASLYELTLGGGSPLPEKFRYLLDHLPGES